MEWMRSYGLREHIHDVNGDYDSDGILNIIEYALGENPVLASRFYTSAEAVDKRLNVRYRKKNDIEDTEVFYLWSKDLKTYHLSGEASSDGTVALITTQMLEGGIEQVTVDVIQGVSEQVYVRMAINHSAVISWGSDREFGGALFSNASQISLVDDELNTLTGPISVGYDPNGIWGYASADQVVLDIDFLGVPLLLIDTSDGHQGLISSSNWSEIKKVSAESPTTVNDYKIGIDDTIDTIIDHGPENNLSRVIVSDYAGVGSRGLAIYVVPNTEIHPGDELSPNHDNDFFWNTPPNTSRADCMFLPFGGNTGIRDIYMFPDSKWGSSPAENWGGFLYKDVDGQFPLNFESGGSVRITAGLYPTSGMKDADIYFLIGKDNFPEIEPYYVTEQLTLTQTGSTDFTIFIPPQPNREFSAVAMYIVQRDVPVRIESFEFITSGPSPDPDPDPIQTPTQTPILIPIQTPILTPIQTQTPILILILIQIPILS
ncbi:MAG: hypothetical protein ACJ0BQ_00435 [Coraliomargaritaceae bacterium]